MDSKTSDIIILGGGLVGLTVAHLCAKTGFSVALVERQAPLLEWDESRFDFRCSAISKGSEKIFQEIGVWEEIKTFRVSPYTRMEVWDRAGFGHLSFDASEVSEPNLGHIVENRVMLKSLWQKALQNPQITLLVANPPTGIEITSKEVRLTLEDEAILTTKLIIGADGAHSWLREKIKIETKREAYEQNALVATVTTELPHARTAWQRFLPEGPLAFLPLPLPHVSSIVWSAAPKTIVELLALEDAQFCQELAHHFDYRLGKILSIMDRKSFPLECLHAKHYVSHRVALVGDAAHVIHPLAGQGVNLGFYDAKRLVEIISDARKNHNDVGDYWILRKYERSRKGQVTAMMAAMTFLNHAFKSASSAMIGARSVGLEWVNKTKILKKKLIQEAMGL